MQSITLKNCSGRMPADMTQATPSFMSSPRIQMQEYSPDPGPEPVLPAGLQEASILVSSRRLPSRSSRCSIRCRAPALRKHRFCSSEPEHRFHQIPSSVFPEAGSDTSIPSCCSPGCGLPSNNSTGSPWVYPPHIVFPETSRSSAEPVCPLFSSSPLSPSCSSRFRR